MDDVNPAVLMILGSCVSLQFGAALAVHLFPVAGSWGTTLFRLALASLLMIVVVRPRPRRWDREQWRAVLGFGLTLAAMNGCFYAALTRIPLGTAVTIEFIGPLTLAAVLSRRARDLAWVVLAGSGIVLLGLDGAGLDGAGPGGAGPGGAAHGLDPVGVLLVLLAGGFWALYILGSARLGEVVPGQGGLAVATGVGALALLPLGATGAVAVFAEPGVMALALGVAVLASIVPYSLELLALRRLSPAVFGILLSLEPVIAVLAGWVLLGQGLTWRGAAAAALVVTASIGSTLTGPRRQEGSPRLGASSDDTRNPDTQASPDVMPPVPPVPDLLPAPSPRPIGA